MHWSLDLNADLGEGSPNDRALLGVISSANVACGAHAGDEHTIRAAIAGAIENGVAIGAHPGYPDRESFGRVEIGATESQIEAWVREQVELLAAECVVAGTRVRYVKPHGALYNRAHKDRGAADAIVRGVVAAGACDVVLAAPGSELLAAAAAAGLRSAREAFLDRAYEPDGALVARGEPGALIDSVGEASARAFAILYGERIAARDGTMISVPAESLCVHGDGPKAVELARAVRSAFDAAHVAVRPFA